MSRPLGSRNKKHTVPERLEADAVTQTELETVAPQVEEKFNNFRPAHDSEKEKEILSTHTVHRQSHIPESDRVDSSRVSLPTYLQHLPEGSDKSKLIVAAAQAALILGTPEAQVALQYGISPSKVAQWKDTLITVGAIGRRDRLSDMLMSFIEQEMKSLMAISMVTSNEEWVERQNASELAHYVAVKSDRLLLLLQAFGRVESTRQQYSQQLQVIEQNG